MDLDVETGFLGCGADVDAVVAAVVGVDSVFSGSKNGPSSRACGCANVGYPERSRERMVRGRRTLDECVILRGGLVTTFVRPRFHV